MTERRPTPEEMLERAAREEKREERGRLKIFLGMAPGVGKTYAMLEEARARKRRGAEVVIGVVMTHGRQETERLAEEMETLPLRSVEHRGIALQEFDPDAALRRRPGLLLVDELAHTNAPGSRHARRWQDVLELLDAGIDVLTTLNVQHVESLNDLVARITQVRVRETVPDSILERADEIEMVDLSPEDLLQRLREGKVYVPAQAERAMQSFFRKGNLIALRELALRKTAERVDAQAEEYQREQGIERTSGTRERVLIALEPSPRAGDVLRAGRRLATDLHAPWIALAVEAPSFDRLPAERRERVSEFLELAERLGGETLVVRGERVAEQIVAIARERNVSRIVVGRPTSRWSALRWPRPLALDVLRRAEGIEVIVTSGLHEDEEKPGPGPRRRPTPLREYPLALVPVATATLVSWLLRDVFGIAEHAMIYLLAVLLAASRSARGPSLLAAVASVLALDFFFVNPVFTFSVTDARHILTFAVMLVAGLLLGNRTVLIREQAEAAAERERRTATLYGLSRAFADEEDPMAVAKIAAEHLRDLLRAETAVYLPADGGLARAASTSGFELTEERETVVARWVHDNGRPAGHGTDTLPSSQALYLPLVGARGTLGVIAIALGRDAEALSPSVRQLLETFVAQAALAIERVTLRHEADRAGRVVETERLRTDLLSSVSHDLRTPLSSIAGAAGVLLAEEGRIGPSERRELLETVQQESHRLSDLVTNLLDLTRLDSGAVKPAKEWCPVDELVHSAVGRLRERLRGRRLEVELPEQVLQVQADPVLIEQALVHLLENAAKYAPEDSPIEIRARGGAGEATIEVSDRGPGIPPGEEQRIFDKFVRLPDGARTQGSGLGLTVCRAIVRAHDGRITVENRLGGGATFRIVLPVGGVPPPPPDRKSAEEAMSAA